MVALITGGAGGIGRALALRLCKQGKKVVIVDLDDAGLVSAAALSSHILPFRCDVTDWIEIERLVHKVESEIGPIDRLYHAAGIMPGRSLLSTPVEEILRVMAVNYGGMVHITKAVLPIFLRRNRGDVIVFGSVVGSVPITNLGAYCASKAAVNCYTEVLTNEHRESGLRFLLVCPSTVDTGLLTQALQRGPKALVNAVQHGRMTSPDRIADAVETALKNGRTVIYPGQEAKAGWMLRRLSPRLMWSLFNRMNR
jgi:NAD(P)-dependent dehydrogenase (short-subunit alcohol dehydrogenase family)